MTITREQVAGLRPGDVVEMTDDRWEGASVRGPLIEWEENLALGVLFAASYAAIGQVKAGSGGYLYVGNRLLRGADGRPPAVRNTNVRVIKRNLPPLYANHPRTQPAPGDVVRKTEPRPGYADNLTWFYDGAQWRTMHLTTLEPIAGDMPRGVTLLVDGTVGQVVQ